MKNTADVLVAGVGGCGASALYHLARDGHRVIGFDRFEPGHDRGSSHGETRVIRQAYFEHPDYVPLLRRAYGLWTELEDESQASLMDLCGLLMIGPPGGEILGGSRLAAERYGVPVEDITVAECAERFPAFSIPEGSDVLWEPSGGYLKVEDCVRCYAGLAQKHGATLNTGEFILSFQSTGAGVEVQTNRGKYSADRLVLTAGAWAPQLLPAVAEAANLHVTRKVLAWYPIQAALPAPTSTFFIERPHGSYYGFPCIDGKTVKLAEHSGGTPLDDPLALDRSLQTMDVHGPGKLIDDVFPSLSSSPVRHDVCMYTMSDDGHFVIDRDPENENVVFAAGFSGHGFKFMSAMGAVMAELAVDGQSTSEIEFLGLERFSNRQ
ncbi:N-methyl-L-tryptophan oxidase [Congregibacter litoralis]|uniref:Glycine/D-amino acid oxidase (Deaminating) n=1 Tax=Congregibacter litoralis KT71 TaxID=314285 RepID=A4AC78_9GAMM|nr:N-methyl-L-tryptophan oxidase [Congregibacter litoralis]EAQ96306.2 Glycine/D-amino acid oxidase (deaminating) [Congregibacter litoralis KT71]